MMIKPSVVKANKPLRKPDWLKISIRSTDNYSHTSETLSSGGLHTICASGRCPNMHECWSRGTATFMICGNDCTRACRFCATNSCAKPAPVDPLEPRRLAASVAQMKLKYAVITSVDRDDMDDYGAGHWAACVGAVKERCPETTVEVLIPDFQGDLDCLQKVLDVKPDVVGHNLETVRRLTPTVRHRATYDTSLKVLRAIADRGFVAKTGIMVGLGETPEEVEELMRDCVANGVSTLTIGQYLRPSKRNIEVVEYVHPDRFAEYKRIGEALGLTHVESGPLVRSSYHADSQFVKAKEQKSLRDLGKAK